MTAPKAPRKKKATDSDVEVPSAPVDERLAGDADDGDGGDASADDGLDERIRQRAYELYCSREHHDGNEMDDWLAAEREVRFGHSSTEGRGSSVLERLDRQSNDDASAEQ